MRSVKPERSHHRDLSYSLRHRQYGWDAPSTNIDFLEYHNSLPVALIEMKRQHEKWDENSANIRAMRTLGDMARLPVFVAEHSDDLSFFTVTPINMKAITWIPTTSTMNEEAWVDLLYRLRGLSMPTLDIFKEPK